MPSLINRIGQKYGRLTVCNREPNQNKRVRWLCKCDCGNESIVIGTSLGLNTVSCGCFGDERRKEAGKNITHGMSGSKVYHVWRGMKRRCENSNEIRFVDYGGRGIKVCERWQSFENFYADMGSPGEALEIERNDVNGNYEPSNCRWATIVEQANNKRNNRMVELAGDMATLANYSKIKKIPYANAYYHKVIKGRAKTRQQIQHAETAAQLFEGME